MYPLTVCVSLYCTTWADTYNTQCHVVSSLKHKDKLTHKPTLTHPPTQTPPSTCTHPLSLCPQVKLRPLLLAIHPLLHVLQWTGAVVHFAHHIGLGLPQTQSEVSGEKRRGISTSPHNRPAPHPLHAECMHCMVCVDSGHTLWCNAVLHALLTL